MPDETVGFQVELSATGGDQIRAIQEQLRSFLDMIGKSARNVAQTIVQSLSGIEMPTGGIDIGAVIGQMGDVTTATSEELRRMADVAKQTVTQMLISTGAIPEGTAAATVGWGDLSQAIATSEPQVTRVAGPLAELGRLLENLASTTSTAASTIREGIAPAATAATSAVQTEAAAVQEAAEAMAEVPVYDFNVDLLELSNTAALTEAEIRQLASALGVPVDVLKASTGELIQSLAELATALKAGEGAAHVMGMSTEELNAIITALGYTGKFTADQFRDFIIKQIEANEASGLLQQGLVSTVKLLQRSGREAQLAAAQQARGFRSTVAHSYETSRAIDILNSATQGLMVGLSATRGSLLGVAMGTYFMRSALLKVWIPMMGVGIAVGLFSRALSFLGSVLKATWERLLQFGKWVGNIAISALKKLVSFIWSGVVRAFEAILEYAGRALEFLIQKLQSAGNAAQWTLRVFQSASGTLRESAAAWLAAADWAVRYGFAIEDVNKALLELWRARILDQYGEALKAAIALSNAWNISLDEAVSTLADAIGTTEGNVTALEEYGIVLDSHINSLDFAARRTAVLDAVMGRFSDSLDARVKTVSGALQRVSSAAELFWQTLLEPIATGLVAPLINALGNIVASVAQFVRYLWAASDVGLAWQRTMMRFQQLLATFAPELEFIATVLKAGLVVAFELLRRVVERVVGALQRFFMWVRQIRVGIQTLAGGAKELSNRLGALAGDFKSLTFQDLLQAAKDLFLNLVPNLDWVITTLEKFWGMFKWLFTEFFLQPIRAFLLGIVNGFNTFAPLIKEKVDDIVAHFEKLQIALQPLADAFEHVFGALGAIVGATLGTVITIALTLVQSLVLALTGEWDKIPQLWEDTWKKIGLNWDTVWGTYVAPHLEEAKKKFLEWVGNTFGEEARKKVDNFLSITLPNFAKDLQTKLAEFFGFKEDGTIGETIAGIGKAITDLVTNLPDLAKLENVKKVIEDLKTAAENTSRALGNLKDAFAPVGTNAEQAEPKLSGLKQTIDDIAFAIEPLTGLLKTLSISLRVLSEVFGHVSASGSGTRAILADVIHTLLTQIRAFVSSLMGGLTSVVVFFRGIADVVRGIAELYFHSLTFLPRLIIAAIRDGIPGVLAEFKHIEANILLSALRVVEGLVEILKGGISLLLTTVWSFVTRVAGLIDLIIPTAHLQDRLAEDQDALTASFQQMYDDFERWEGKLTQGWSNLFDNLRNRVGLGSHDIVQAGQGMEQEFGQVLLRAGTTATTNFTTSFTVPDRFKYYNSQMLEEATATFGPGGRFESVFQNLPQAAQPCYATFDSLARDIQENSTASFRAFDAALGPGGGIPSVASQTDKTTSQPVRDAFTSMKNWTNTAVQNVSDFFSRTFGAGGPVQTTAASVAASISNFFTVSIPNAFRSMRDSAQSIIEQVKVSFTGVFGPGGALALITSAVGANVLQFLTDAITGFRDNVWVPVVNGLRDVFNGVFAAGGAMASAASSFGTNVTEKIKNFISGMKTRINELVGEIRTKWEEVFGTSRTAGALEAAWNRLKGALESIWSLMKGPLEALRDLLNRIRSNVEWILSNIGRVTGTPVRNVPPGAQEGGIFTRPQVRTIAEAGPEAVIPLVHGAVPVLLQGSGPGTTIQITITGNTFLSPDDAEYLADILSERIASQLRRRRVFVTT